MTRSGNKTVFPMPTSGVIADQHPFAVGPGQLTKSQNWLNEDGIFRTRDGLLSVDPPKRWYENLVLSENLVPFGLAEGDPSGISDLIYDSLLVSVTSQAENSIFGDHQYLAEVTHGTGDDVETIPIEIEPGLDYTAWVFSGEETESGDIWLDVLDADDEVIESFALEGDQVLQGLWSKTITSHQQAAAARFRVSPTESKPIYFGPMKLAQADGILAWTHGEGYSGDIPENLFDVGVAHPEDTQEVIAAWEPIHGKESPACYAGQGLAGLFDGYDSLPCIGRATAFSAVPTKEIPSYLETLGLSLNEEYRAVIVPGTQYRISASYYFDVESRPIADMEYRIEVVFYDESGSELSFRTLVRSIPVQSGDSLVLTETRGRTALNFTAPALAVACGLRIICVCPTAEREIVYDNYGEIVYENNGTIVTIEGENFVARRVGFILDDVKLVEASGSGDRWWDFKVPEIEHTGPAGRGEYPLNYLPHDYLFEGSPEADRIVMATDKSIWKWNDTINRWELVGFDLGTITSAVYLVGENEDTEEPIYTLDERLSFRVVGDGYTAAGVEEETLTVEVTLPAASEDSESPEPGGWWKYRVNGGDWSDQFVLSGDNPVLSAGIEYNSRSIGVEIVLAVTDNDDFSDVCTIPEGETLEDPVFQGVIVSRKHDGQVDETAHHADRDNPVDMRGYDFAQKTYLVFANRNDRVTAWDGRPDSKVERAGSNAPFARTICISGGRVLAGNVIFDDPYTDLIAPLAVVYSDTFLSRGFRNWHPELAIRLADTPGEIVKLLEMGTLAVSCYKTDALYMLVYQTGNNPFRTQLMASNIAGPIGVRAVTALSENSHLFVGEDGGVYMFDGSYPTNFSQSVSRTIQNELDLSYKDRSFMAYSPRMNAALAMYPTKGSAGRVNRGMWIDITKRAGWPFEWDGTVFDFSAGAPVQTIDHYKMGGVTVRLGHLASALASGQSLQPDFFMGTLDGTTYVMDKEARDDWGNAVKAIFRTGLTEFGLQDRFSLLKEMEFIFDRANSPHEVDVEIWAGDYGPDVRPVDHQTIDIFADGPYEAEIRRKARYWGYSLAVDALEHIKYHGTYVSMAPLGRR